MKKRSNVNWLVLITVCLMIAAFSMFYVSLKDGLGLKKCVYSEGSTSNGCSCNSKGELVCEDDSNNDVEKVSSSEFTSVNLTYSYNFLNFVDSDKSVNNGVGFVDITNMGSDLKVRIEKKSLCNVDSFVAPQVGFYKKSENALVLTVVSNLVDSSFNIPCVTEETFKISGLKSSYPADFKIFYQDEYDVLNSANNCVYEGFLRNDGDTYQSLDGCALCNCSQGQNKCELENSCLE